ncbi:hypothetical protein AAFP30_07020 [Gordonia sp. CPCC 205515]|uniref:hypothetical protein n=1 Tax=Gordonia sp. CPCC 205515 TaxID=3140791 RepID=UPI003AF33D7A
MSAPTRWSSKPGDAPTRWSSKPGDEGAERIETTQPPLTEPTPTRWSSKPGDEGAERIEAIRAQAISMRHLASSDPYSISISG